MQLPFLYDMNVNVHNNSITANSSYGDELFSATPSAAGGVTFCTGADYYKFNYNWVCGNLSTGDGGGVAHEGFIYNGNIAHNWILFNQSNNISIPTNGGGIAVLGAAPDGTPAGSAPGTECGSVTDVDCAPGLSDGTGPGLVIDSNLIMGNTAESGSGGGIRLQTVNGTEVTRFPLTPDQWYEVTRHQQHHRQQRCGLGRRRRVAAGRLEGQLHQQHDRRERHDGFGGCAVQYAGSPPGQYAAAVDMQPRRGVTSSSTDASGSRPGDHAEHLEPHFGTAGEHARSVPGGSSELHIHLIPVARQRPLLAKPLLPYSGRRNGYRESEPTEHRDPGSDVEPGHHRRLR